MNQHEFNKYAVKHLGINSNTLDAYAKHNSNEIVGMTPYVLEERQMRYSQIDIFSRLMADRIIFLGQGINDDVANIVTGQLLFLESADPARDIQIYLNSPGGSVYAGLGIYDTMQLVKPDIATICTGMAASMGAILMAAGAKDKRSALKHSRIMIHQPMGGISGGTQATDMEITVKEINKLKIELYEILAEHTGKDIKQITKDADRDYWMTSTEAKEYGMIDEILVRNK